MKIEPINELATWTQQLGQIAAQPLELCPDFPCIAQRTEAWWAHECLDRPLFIGTANPRPERPITRRLELLAQPDEWFAAKQADMLQVHRVGDALPHVRADFGPVLLGGMLGGKIEFGADTTWTHAFIDDDWSNAPDWQLPDDNPWWCMLQARAQRVASEAKGRFLLCTPDLGGSGDVLLNLRGSAPLCMDVAECPERIIDAVNAIYPGVAQSVQAAIRNRAWGRRGVDALGGVVVQPALHGARVRLQFHDQPAPVPAIAAARHRPAGRNGGARRVPSRRPRRRTPHRCPFGSGRHSCHPVHPWRRHHLGSALGGDVPEGCSARAARCLSSVRQRKCCRCARRCIPKGWR